MKTRFSFVAVLLVGLFTSLLPAAEAPKASPKSEPSPLAVLASFVGGTWTGALPADPDGSVLKIEMRFTWAENKQAVRFDSSFVKGDKRAPYSSGLYAWNAAKKKLVIVYTDSSGSLSEGTIAPEGDALVHDLTVTSRTGATDSVQARLTKSGNDVFTNAIFVQKDGAWNKIVEVRYERQKQ
jgi:hypothetical protein